MYEECGVVVARERLKKPTTKAQQVIADLTSLYSDGTCVRENYV
jgi:hypothetical protein